MWLNPDHVAEIMAEPEPRRVQLTTLSRHVPPASSDRPDPIPDLDSATDPVHRPSIGNVNHPQEKDADPGQTAANTDTVRLVLTLFEPDERSFPEFSYTQLIDNKVGFT